MRLFVTELLRFWSRRITWITLGAAALVMVLSVGYAFTQYTADPPPAEALDFDAACVARMLNDYRDGEDYFGPGGPEFETEAEFIEFAQDNMCRNWDDPDDRFHATSMLGPKSDDWSENRRPDYGTGFERTADGQEIRQAEGPLEGIIPGIAIAFLLISVILGASYMGAEYKAGTVENLLLWEPRRPKVIFTKYAAGFLSAFMATALAMGLLSGLLVLLATFRGTFDGVDGRFWTDLVSVIGRASLVGGAFFVLAMAIATIFKNTTAALGAILGWFVLTNVFIELFFKSVRQYELFVNAVAFIGEAETPKLVDSGREYDIWAYSHGYLTAGVYVAIWAVVVGLIAVVIFNRRDVT